MTLQSVLSNLEFWDFSDPTVLNPTGSHPVNLNHPDFAPDRTAASTAFQNDINTAITELYNGSAIARNLLEKSVTKGKLWIVELTNLNAVAAANANVLALNSSFPNNLRYMGLDGNRIETIHAPNRLANSIRSGSFSTMRF